jgi:hypothetical protein
VVNTGLYKIIRDYAGMARESMVQFQTIIGAASVLPSESDGQICPSESNGATWPALNEKIYFMVVRIQQNQRTAHLCKQDIPIIFQPWDLCCTPENDWMSVIMTNS